jgi:hypothetical protein
MHGGMQGGGPAGNRDGASAMDKIGEILFEGRPFRSGGQPIAAQHFDNSGQVIIVDALAAIG